MPLWWEDNIQSKFLDAEAIHRILPYMAKATSESSRSAELKHDPITATAIVFLTCPLQLGLTEVGAMVFQGHASLVYPYSLMSDRQKQFVRECLSRRSEWSICNGCVLFRRSKPDCKDQPRRTLQQSTVLVALCDRIANSASGRRAAADSSGQHADQAGRGRLALCNIILQRLQGYVTIHKPVQKELNDWLASRKDISKAPVPSAEHKESP